jgi:squalene cyclase
MAANRPQDRPHIELGIRFLISKQVASGDWPHEGITGVFNNNCMITYMNYRNEFPIKALGFSSFSLF